MYKRIHLIFVLLQGWIGLSQAGTLPKIYDAPFLPGERIVYVAEYMSMEIARIEFHLVGTVDTLNTTLFHARATLQSNPRVPLIVVRDRYDAYFDAEGRPYLHTGKGQRRRYAFRLQYRFDHEAGTVSGWEYRQKGFEEKLRGQYRAEMNGLIFDPLTLFYYIRAFLKQRGTYERETLHVFANGKTRVVQIRPHRTVQNVRLIQQELLGFPLDLKLKFKGIAGIRDIIQFIMSADQKILPVTGELRFALGKMKIRLKEYHPGKWPFVQSADQSGFAAPVRLKNQPLRPSPAAEAIAGQPSNANSWTPGSANHK